MIHQRHLRDRFMTAQFTSHAEIGNRGRPNHRDTMINRLHERGIHCRRPARCQGLTRHQYLLRFFFVSGYFRLPYFYEISPVLASPGCAIQRNVISIQVYNFSATSRCDLRTDN